eukprot:2189569-Pyramimonas_sp.AAC.1
MFQVPRWSSGQALKPVSGELLRVQALTKDLLLASVESPSPFPFLAPSPRPPNVTDQWTAD